MSNWIYKTAYFSEIYRWITYAFQNTSLYGFIHNVVPLILFGLPLEGLIGSIPMLGLSFLFVIIPAIVVTYIYYFAWLITSDRSFLYQGFYFHSFSWSFAFVCDEAPLFANIVGFRRRSRHFPFILLFLFFLDTILDNLDISSVSGYVGCITGLCYHYGFLNYFSLPRVLLLWFEKKTKIGIFLSQNIPNFVPTRHGVLLYMEIEQFEWTTKRYRYRIDLDRLSLDVFFKDLWNFIISGCCFCSKMKFGAQLEETVGDGDTENLLTQTNLSNPEEVKLSEKNENLGVNQPLCDDIESNLDLDGTFGQENVEKDAKNKIKTKLSKREVDAFDNIEEDRHDEDQLDFHQCTDTLLHPDSYIQSSIQGDDGDNISVHRHGLPAMPSGGACALGNIENIEP
jgi:hypothetical protein